jgi:ComF family protein
MGLWWHALADFFFPPRCPFCGDRTQEEFSAGICFSCFAQIRKTTHPHCPRCGVSFASDTGQDHLCSDCLPGTGYFTKARAVAHYEGIMPEIISRYKYRGDSRLAKSLGDLLAGYEDPDFSFRDYRLVVPVPLHFRRLRQRGFNQSLLLARRLSRKYCLPLDFTTLRRIRATVPQTELSAAERRKNIRGAFAVFQAQAVREKDILLVDDVFTTGATVEECARVLLKAGANRVDILTLARAR